MTFQPNPSRSIDPVSLSALQQQEHARNVWVLNVPVGTLKADLTDHRMWVGVASKLRLYDLVDVLPDDGSWYAQLIVRSVDRTMVKMGEVRFVDFAEADTGSELADYEVKWRNPSRRFGLFRKADGELVKDGFSSRDEAVRWAAEQPQLAA